MHAIFESYKIFLRKKPRKQPLLYAQLCLCALSAGLGHAPHFWEIGSKPLVFSGMGLSPHQTQMLLELQSLTEEAADHPRRQVYKWQREMTAESTVGLQWWESEAETHYREWCEHLTSLRFYRFAAESTLPSPTP